jgi:hypothetical protein
MYKFAGYGIKIGGDIAQFARNFEIATTIKQQKHLNDDAVVMLYVFEQLKEMAPVKTQTDDAIDLTKEDDGTN